MSPLDHLAKLVAFDTQNPPRDPAVIGALLDYAARELAAARFAIERRDLGDGCQWLLARRGAGGLLVNVHVDTVPADPGWKSSPHALSAVDGTATGLGACDIKGALAAYLAAASSTSDGGELLLTSDEEAGSSVCVRTFVKEYDMRGRRVLVAEPTRCRAVTAHRGIGTCSGAFTGVAGHASNARALIDSALHEAVRWAARALEVTARDDVRYNLGVLEGGVKANMIASSARVRFGVRPMRDPRAVVDEICALAPDRARVTWDPGYVAPALTESAASRALARDLALDTAAPVDFFTEAALFAEAGAHAIVCGPGDIAQAHAAGEFVAVAEIEQMQQIYARMLS